MPQIYILKSGYIKPKGIMLGYFDNTSFIEYLNIGIWFWALGIYMLWWKYEDYCDVSKIIFFGLLFLKYINKYVFDISIACYDLSWGLGQIFQLVESWDSFYSRKKLPTHKPFNNLCMKSD